MMEAMITLAGIVGMKVIIILFLSKFKIFFYYKLKKKKKVLSENIQRPKGLIRGGNFDSFTHELVRLYYVFITNMSYI